MPYVTSRQGKFSNIRALLRRQWLGKPVVLKLPRNPWGSWEEPKVLFAVADDGAAARCT